MNSPIAPGLVITIPYLTKSTDTLESIAWRFGISVEHLKAYNAEKFTLLDSRHYYMSIDPVTGMAYWEENGDYTEKKDVVEDKVVPLEEQIPFNWLER